MEIIVESRSIPLGVPGSVRYREDPGRGLEQLLHALVRAGLSEETAREQITRLSAGDIWCG